ncbi:MAG: diacylglycerol/lipid kinase family protein [Acidobacteriota bacterium]
MPAIAFIYNPRAGKLLRNPGLVERTITAVRSYGPVESCPTTGPRTAGALAQQQIAQGAEWVVVLGGDGTVNEVANGMIGSHAALAPLPGGTANVLCVETGIGTNPLKAAAALGLRQPRRIAVGHLKSETTDRHFLAMAGAGLDATVVNTVNPAIKDKLGKLAYWVSGFGMVGRSLAQFHSDIDGFVSQNSYLLASRVRNYGGDLEIARHVSLLDNCFEAVSFTGVNSFRYLPYLVGVLAGRPALFPGVDVRPAQALDCRAAGSQPVPVQIDGEAAGFLPARIAIVPDALTLLLPRTYLERAKRKPWITSPTR